MTKTDQPERSNYWHCGFCGTPNPAAVYLTLCVACGKFRSEAAPPRPSMTDPGSTRRPPRWLLVATFAYGLILLGTFTLARLGGDEWWPGAVIRLSPRGIFLAPLIVLGIWSGRQRRPWIGAMIGLEAIVVAWPLMGFVIPLGRERAGPGGIRLRIMTFNRSVNAVDVPRLIRYLENQRIDLICFQEFSNGPSLDSYLKASGWHRDGVGAILSRYPIVAQMPRLLERNEDRGRYTALMDRARIEGPGGRQFVVASIHMPTLRPGFGRLVVGDVSGFRTMLRWWSSEAVRVVESIRESSPYPVLLGGDFNNIVEGTDIGDLLEAQGFRSAFDRAGLGWGYTRPAVFPWARIDHLFASSEWSVVACWVGPSFGSDHRSLIAEVSLPPELR